LPSGGYETKITSGALQRYTVTDCSSFYLCLLCLLT